MRRVARTPNVATYLGTGGEKLVEIAPARNAMLHARPGIDATVPDQPLRLIRMPRDLDSPSVISDTWLDELIQRLDGIHVELHEIRPPFDVSISEW